MKEVVKNPFDSCEIVKSENRIQSEAFLWFHNEFPNLRGLLYHVPNGEYRDKITASKLKSMGVVSGVPDIVFHYRGKTWFFEFKDEKGRVTTSQEKIHCVLREQGFIVWIIRDVKHFQETVSGIVANDLTDPMKVGMSKVDYFYRHKVFEYIYTQIQHNEIVLVDDIVSEENKIKFISYVQEFIRFRFDEKDNFELLFTEDFEAFYRRDIGKTWEPIFYKGKSIPQ